VHNTTPLTCLFPCSLQLDMGQCNDAYSAIVVASKLAEVRSGVGVLSHLLLAGGL